MPQSVSFTNPYQTEQAAIERQRRFAQALQQQAFEPIQSQTPQGGFTVPVSPLQGFAKLAQALAGRKMDEQATDEQKALQGRMTSERSATLAKALELGQGTPERWSGDEALPEDALYTPAQPGNQRAMYTHLAGSQDPVLQQAGLAQLLKTTDSPWAKVDPKDYTPQSVAAFASSVSSGNPNPALLQPARKREAVTGADAQGRPQTQFIDPYEQQTPIAQPVRRDMVNLGDTVQPVDPYAQTQPIARRETPEGFTRGPDGMLKIDPGFLAGKKEIAAAGRPLTQTQVNVPPASQVFQNEDKLRADYTTATKPFVGIRDAYNTVSTTLAGEISAPATLAAATKFMKMLDPESVVRESELNMALRSTGMLDRFMNLHNVITKGQVLTPTQVTEIQRIAGELYKTADAQQKKVDDYYGGLATQYGLSPDRVIQRNRGAVTNPGRRASDFKVLGRE